MKWITCFIAIATATCQAERCNSFFVRRNVQTVVTHQAIPAIAHPQVVYSVAPQLQLQAQQTYQMKHDTEFQQFLQMYRQFQAYRQGLKDAGPPEEPRSLVSQKCGQCHGSQLSSPKGETFIDPSLGIAAGTITESLRQIRDNAMPPDATLTNEEKAQLMDELLNFQTRENEE